MQEYRPMRCEIKEGFDSRLRARSGPALTLHRSVIHSRPFKSLQAKKPEEKSSGLAEKEGFDSRLRVRSGPALTLHRSIIHSRPFKSLQTKKPEEKSSGLAEKEGFEPSRQLSHPTPLAGEPLRPLGYFSTAYDMIFGGERGIRTPGALRHHWFSRPAP